MKKFKKGEWVIIILTLCYILGFSLYYFLIANYEFLWYILVLVFFFFLILLTLNRSKFDYVILGGLSIWGLLHLAGGGLLVKGKVLYALELIPLFKLGDSVILKFDQFVHFFGFGVASLVVYHLLIPYLNEKTNWKVIYFIVLVGGMGLGALNEIIEFMAVVFFPETGVGGYFNTGLDLVFNFLGALAALLFIKVFKYKRMG